MVFLAELILLHQAGDPGGGVQTIAGYKVIVQATEVAGSRLILRVPFIAKEGERE